MEKLALENSMFSIKIKFTKHLLINFLYNFLNNNIILIEWI